MRKLAIIFILTAIPSIVSADVAIVTVRVCEADETTLFDNRDIMVGTKLTIIIHSETADMWAGDLAILGDYQNYGVLSARDWNDVTLDYEGSHYPAAGSNARVVRWTEEGILGFSFSNSYTAIANQDWFIIDYTATAVGDCNVAFYQFPEPYVPQYFLPSTGAFHHVPTRDFNQNTIVDFPDFAILAYYWQQNCTEDCEGADLNGSGNVNLEDLRLFCDYWLEETE